MPTSRLTQRRVDALKPRRKTCDIRDAEITGFGVRILPSGRKRYFLRSQIDGTRVWHAIGGAEDITLEGARTQARALLASRRHREKQASDTFKIPFEVVAEEVFRRYRRHWKPSTLKVNLGYYRNHILPWFRGRPIADITRRDIQQWFASLHATPVAADRSAPVLSVILKQAEVYGYRPEGSNPCTGIKRYRRRGRERFLTADEMRRLSRVLDRHRESYLLETSIARLLLLTGCRKSEILTLKWSEYREGKLHLSDSKTGPRTVWLSSASRRVLNGLQKSGPWVFPSPRRNSHPSRSALHGFWRNVRAEAGIEDVRCHDLRQYSGGISRSALKARDYSEFTSNPWLKFRNNPVVFSCWQWCQI